MPPKTRGKNPTEPRIGPIDWHDNLIWGLLAELDKPENFRVLFGKKDKSENTSGETKITVYARIAEKILPDLYHEDGKSIRDRVKTKVESLTTKYAKYAKRLRATGEGVKTDSDSSTTGSEETYTYYIGGEGPCVETPMPYLNIWREIEKEFIFFPSLHKIFATRANVTPITITTPLGPNGPKTVWVQPPDGTGHVNSSSSKSLESGNEGLVGDDPSSQPVPDTQVSTRSFGTDATNTPRTPVTMQRGPKESLESREALKKATNPPSSSKSKASAPKRTLADTMFEIQRENLSAQKAQNKAKLNVELRKQIASELSLGIWSVEEARQKIQELTDHPSPPPAKKPRRLSSPEWSSDLDAPEVEL